MMQASCRQALVAISLLTAALLAGCATPAVLFDRRAEQLGLQRQFINGAGFTHAVYRNRQRQRSGRLHVYLGGDGSPYLRRRWIARDPTPRRPLGLELLAQDPNPGIYLGRPCYHGQRRGCSPLWWTSHRYAPQVVASLEAVVRRLYRGGPQRLVLIGYSGGGALAMLLAARLAPHRLAGVMTVAANLDPPEWVRLHRYSPLSGSLNPAELAPLPAAVRQTHYAGGRDRNLPPVLLRQALTGQPHARLVIEPAFGHHCCWAAAWPQLLAAAGHR